MVNSSFTLGVQILTSSGWWASHQCRPPMHPSLWGPANYQQKRDIIKPSVHHSRAYPRWWDYLINIEGVRKGRVHYSVACVRMREREKGNSLLLRDGWLYGNTLSLLRQQLQVISGKLQQLPEGSGLCSRWMTAHILLIVHRLHHLRQRHLEHEGKHDEWGEHEETLTEGMPLLLFLFHFLTPNNRTGPQTTELLFILVYFNATYSNNSMPRFISFLTSIFSLVSNTSVINVLNYLA